jgi:uncharacterized protein YbjQ (UPF0145 family)
MYEGMDKISAGGQKDAKAAGEFFIKAFFQGLRVERNDEGLITFRSLVVDSMIPDADVLQSALDRFAELSDTVDKTQERFEFAIKFAQQFNTAVAELKGPATSSADAINLLRQAAVANGITISNYYSKFLSETSEVFGESSKEYAKALDAAQSNALAQIGLTRVTEDGVDSIISLTEAQSSLNAGYLLVTDTIEKVVGAVTALETVQLDNIGDLVTQAINTQLREAVGTTGDILRDSISLLTNPATEAVMQLEEILSSGSDRIENLQGVVNGLQDALNSGSKINTGIVRKAEKNVQLAQKVVDLQVSEYLSGLNAEQLKAVVSTEDLTDATRNLAQSQLEYLESISSQKAISSLLSVGKSLSRTLADITGSFKILRIGGLMALNTDIDTLTKNLGLDSISAFATNLYTAINSISNGINVSKNSN